MFLRGETYYVFKSNGSSSIIKWYNTFCFFDNISIWSDLSFKLLKLKKLFKKSLKVLINLNFKSKFC